MSDAPNSTICNPPLSLECIQTMAYLLATELRSVAAGVEQLQPGRARTSREPTVDLGGTRIADSGVRDSRLSACRCW